MRSELRADHTTLREVSLGLEAVRQRHADALDDAGRAARTVIAEIERELARRRVVLHQADEALAACERGPGPCGQERARVEEARRGVERAVAALRCATDALASFDGWATGSKVSSEQSGREGRALLDRFARRLQDYQGLAAGIGTIALASAAAGGSSGGSSGPAHSGLPAGHELVEVDAIDVSDSGVHGRADFGKGYSPEDLAWAMDALDRVVLPNLRVGRGADYFAMLDQQQYLMGTRSYSSTFHGFFGGDAIRLARRADGRYDVANGYHRIWVAQRLGRSTVPARVVS